MLNMSLLFNLFNGNEKVSIVIVSSRFNLGLLDHIECALETMPHLLEDSIHFFQRSVCSLREEEIDRRNHDGVDDSKDDICVGSNILKCWRGNHNHQPVEDPVT